MGAVLSTSFLQAQSDRFAYAVTDVQQEGANWSFLRKIDLQTSQYSKVLLDGNDITLKAYDAVSRKAFETPLTDARYGNLMNAAFGTGVAAMAYDKSNNRLWYTPMFIDQLRYIDLKTMKVFYITDQSFMGSAQKASDQSNIITRMVIASDGNGYALTNDAQHLVQFTTGKKTKITDLGMLVDDPSNKGVSIHNSCSSFGGDVIADDDGNLYVFTARNHAFKVNIESKVATHLGTVNGLPASFTINGAAVNDNNEVLISTAGMTSSWFTVDMKSLSASANTAAGTVWRTSDLANSNLLATNKPGVNNTTDIISRNNPVVITPGSYHVQVYPNPVTNNQFMVQFNQVESGNYTILVTDALGRQVIQQTVNISGDNQSQQLRLKPSSARGIYLVKINDGNNRAVFSSKIVVQ
jgi:hypothetical protein